MRDAFGEPLAVGDYVGFVPSEQGSPAIKGRVLDIKKKIKIVVTHVDDSGTKGSWWGAKVGEERWIHSHRTTRTLKNFAKVDDPDPCYECDRVEELR